MKSRWVSDTLCVGLELEYEGVSSDVVMEKYAQKYEKRLLAFGGDGSLRPRRQNTEVKFNGPLAGSLIDEALAQVTDLLSWHRHRISWRCGMHVHVDCHGIEFARPYRSVILATLIEPILFAWDGTGRQENKFCQSIVDSVYSYLPPVRHKKGQVMPALTKYSLLNLRSLFTLGTLELRFAGSTKSMTRVIDFINLGMGLREASLGFNSGEELIVSVLEAPRISSWLEQHTHPLFAEQLVPVAERGGFMEPPIPAMNAALALAEYEKQLTPTIVGGR